MKSLRILLLAFLMSCNELPKEQKSNGNSIVDSMKKEQKEDTLNNVSKTDNKTPPIEFESHEVLGFILPDTLHTFSPDLSPKYKLTVTHVEPIQIHSITREKYFLHHDSDECTESNYVNITLKDNSYLVFGNDVFEVEGRSPLFTFKTQSTTYEILAASNFGIGAIGRNGLSGCDDYSLLVIHRLPTDDYSLIKMPESYWYTYASLTHSDQAEEDVYNHKMSGDTIVLSIKSHGQTGSEKYDLKILYKPLFSIGTISDLIAYPDYRTDSL